MDMNVILPVIAIAFGVAVGIAQMVFIVYTLMKAFRPRWREAWAMKKILMTQLGIRSRIVAVEPPGIVRLVVMNQFPVAHRLDDVKQLLMRDIRLETDKKNRPVLVVLPPFTGIPKKGHESQVHTTPVLTPEPA